jgi:hypothetical protein
MNPPGILERQPGAFLGTFGEGTPHPAGPLQGRDPAVAERALRAVPDRRDTAGQTVLLGPRRAGPGRAVGARRHNRQSSGAVTLAVLEGAESQVEL